MTLNRCLSICFMTKSLPTRGLLSPQSNEVWRPEYCLLPTRVPFFQEVDFRCPVPFVFFFFFAFIGVDGAMMQFLFLKRVAPSNAGTRAQRV